MKTITKVLAGYVATSAAMQLTEYVTCKTHCFTKLYDKLSICDSKTIDEIREIENRQVKIYENRSAIRAIIDCIVAPVNAVKAGLFSMHVAGDVDKEINYVKEVQNS